MQRVRLLLSVIFIFLLSRSLFAQVDYSVNNLLRFGDGRERKADTEPKKEYIENLSNVRLFWKDFTIGFRYLYDNPPEFGPRFQGIKKRYIEFARSGLEIRAGDFFTLYGRGLAMNLFENRGINYDTGLDGLRASYSGDIFNAILALGKFDYFDLLDVNRIESYTIRSGNIEFKPISFLRIGGSFVHGDGEIPNGSKLSKVQADIPEVNISLKGFGFDFTASYANKRSFIERFLQFGNSYDQSLEKTGEGFYSSLAFTSDQGFGISLEYKDYRFDVVNQSERNSVRDTRMLPFQNPPIVFKEHSFTLLTRAPHIIDFNDEIGFQIEAFYQVAAGVTLNANGSVASRHQTYSKIPNTFKLRPAEETRFFPSLKKEYAPFWETYLECEWYFTDESYLRIAFNRRYDVTNDSYDFARDIGNTHTVSSSTVPARLEYAIGNGYSIAGDLEVQFVHDSQIKSTPNYNNQFLALTLTRAPEWSASVRIERSNNAEEPSRKLDQDYPMGQFWVVGEFTYRLGNAHTISVSYGTERGGLICASGICRQLNPFNGVRLTLLTQW